MRSGESSEVAKLLCCYVDNIVFTEYYLNKVPTVDEREWRHSRYRKRMENIRQELEGLEVCCAHSTDDYLKVCFREL